jgi:hypothetical protein
MNVMSKFLTIFSGDEKDIAAEQARLDSKKRDLEQNAFLAAQRDSRYNARDAAIARIEARGKELDGAAQEFSEADFARLYFGGQQIGDLAVRLVAKAEFKKRLPKIKIELEKLIVAPAKKALADFLKENKSALAKIPPPKKMAEPEFVPPPSSDDASIFAPQPQHPGVRAMLGLAPGQTLPPLPWEVKDDGLTKIRDLDPD